MTVEELTKLAMLEMQVIDPRKTPTTSEYSFGLQRLNTLIASLQNDMVFLAYQDVKSIETVSGTSTYATSTNTYRVRGFSDDDVNIISRREYDQYTASSTVKDRIDIFIEYNVNPPTINFASAPTTSGTTYYYRRDALVTDLTTGDSVSLKNNALEMLILGLAYKLCPAYGVEVSRRDSIKKDYLEELNKYRQAQTFRVGDEIVKPTAIEVV